MIHEWINQPQWFDQLGLMKWPLAICSVIMLAISFERLIFLVKSKTSKQKTYRKLSNGLIKNKRWSKVIRDELMSIAFSEIRPSYYRGIKGLKIIGVISPMLGLLGTILGIIAAFKVIALEVGPVSPNMIADGLWEAMLTTAAGLMIALPAILMAHFFSYRSELQLQDFYLKLNKLSIAIDMDNEEKISM